MMIATASWTLVVFALASSASGSQPGAGQVPPTKYEAIEGSDYTLTCSAADVMKKSNTNVRISWQYCDTSRTSAASKGIDIEPTSRRYVRYAADGFVSYLQFKFVDRSDMGKYICEIQNITLGAADGETTKQEFHLKVIWVDIPQVVVVSRTESEVTLGCEFNAWDSAMVSIRWILNHSPVIGPTELSMARNLTIQTNRVEATGLYQCLTSALVHFEVSSTLLGGLPSKWRNTLLSSNWYFLIPDNRTAPYLRVDFSRYEPFKFVQAKQPYQLECPYLSNSSSGIGWERLIYMPETSASSDWKLDYTAKAIEPYEPYDIRFVGQTSTITTSLFEPGESSHYFNFLCLHWSHSGDPDAELTDVKVPFSVGMAQSQVPKVLYILVTPTSTYSATMFAESEVARTNLCLTAILKPTVVNTTYRWTLPSQADGPLLLSPGEQVSGFESYRLPNGNVRLCVKPKFVLYGTYTFLAQNQFGESSLQTEIHDWSLPKLLSYSSSDQQLLKVQTDSSKDRNERTEDAYSMVVREGTTITIRCNVSGPQYPTTSIYWKWSPFLERKNYMLRYNSSTVTVMERNGLLQLSNVTVATSGNYTCAPIMLFYPAGIDTAVISINVTRVLKVINATAVVDDGFLRLQCFAESEVWNANANVTVITDSGLPVQVNVTQVNPHVRLAWALISKGAFPGRKFFCNTRSGLENASKAFAVEVRPNMLIEPGNATVMDGESIMLDCQPENLDDWRVHWKPAGQVKPDPIGDCANPNLDPCALANGSLLFRKAEPEMAGLWICLVAMKGIVFDFDYDYNDTVHLLVAERLADSNNITRTVTIVIVSAVVYLALVVIITLWCSVRLVHKRKRRTIADDTQLTLLGSDNIRPNGKANGSKLKSSLTDPVVNGVANGASSAQVSPSTLKQALSATNGSLHSAPYNSAVHSPIGSMPQMNASPGTLPPPPASNVFPPRSVPAYAWPIQDIRSTLTRTSCSTCDGLSAGGVMVFCALHSAAMPSAMVSEYPQSVLSHQTNVTSVSQQMYHRDRPSMIHHPATTTPNSQSNCSSEAVRHLPRSQVQFLGRIGLGRFGEVTFGQLVFAHAGAPDQMTQAMRVAIKALTRADEDARRDFHKEIDTFHGIQHAFVTELIGVCLEDEPMLLLFEYPEWGTLKHFLLAVRADHERLLQALMDGLPLDEQAPLPPLSFEQRIMMCLHVTAGMDFLANHGRVHGELACRNLLLAPNLSLKVGLLGVHDVFPSDYYSLPLSSTSSLGRNGSRAARSKSVALRWLAPECAAHEMRVAHLLDHESAVSGANCNSSGYSSASDVWAFAMTVFEIFSYCELPFATLTNEQVLDTLLNASVDNGEQLVSELATRCTPRFAHAHISAAGGKVNGVLPDARFNDFSRNGQSLRHILEQCWRTDARQRPSFAEISVALGEQLSDSKL